ncbi:melanoregulin isoform X5 [Phocoena sinus]|uniref:Melanoregulin n=1 Tax=Phocoena sinus TaxID=42100 RepID=A0A8C9CFD4_PHOSS|nr:melanoregulin isoform X5 [Phocoena sinus]
MGQQWNKDQLCCPYPTPIVNRSRQTLAFIFLLAAPLAHFLLEPSDNPYSSFGATLARDDEKNLWSVPHDVSHTEADDDRILYNLIVVRNQQAKDSEEWQKLNYDIYTLRQIRREVRNRWKRILEDLGFQKEVDSLLSVTKLSTISDSRNTREAREILLRLAEETNIFPTSWELSERYLFVVDRLIALDAAEEFFKVASQTYPKKPGVPCQADGQKGLHYLPFPSP